MPAGCHNLPDETAFVPHAPSGLWPTVPVVGVGRGGWGLATYSLCMPPEHLSNLRRRMWSWRVARYALYVVAMALFVSSILGLASHVTGSTWWLTSEQYLAITMALSFAVTGLALWCTHTVGGKAALRRLFEKK